MMWATLEWIGFALARPFKDALDIRGSVLSCKLGLQRQNLVRSDLYPLGGLKNAKNRQGIHDFVEVSKQQLPYLGISPHPQDWFASANLGKIAARCVLPWQT
jgi:hypothetical protein